MSEWWSGLSTVNQAFYCAAAFFSVAFAWQLISVFMGLDGGDGMDVDIDSAGAGHVAGDFDHGAQFDAAETVAAFRLLSMQSLVTFFTLFCWGSALYLSRGDSVARAMGVSAVWGLAGMTLVAFILHQLPKLAHTGTRNLRSCLGSEGTVYLDIPAGGTGEIRVSVSDVISHVKARAAGGEAMKSGAPVRVRRVLDTTTVEVEAVGSGTKGGAT